MKFFADLWLLTLAFQGSFVLLYLQFLLLGYWVISRHPVFQDFGGFFAVLPFRDCLFQYLGSFSAFQPFCHCGYQGHPKKVNSIKMYNISIMSIQILQPMDLRGLLLKQFLTLNGKTRKLVIRPTGWYMSVRNVIFNL